MKMGLNKHMAPGLYQINGFSGCEAGYPAGSLTVYCRTTTFTFGTQFFENPEGTSPFVGIFIGADGHGYGTDPDGFIETFTESYCFIAPTTTPPPEEGGGSGSGGELSYQTINVSSSCFDGEPSLYERYDVYIGSSSSLTNGTLVYSDTIMSSPLTHTTFYKEGVLGGVSYTTDSVGQITNIVEGACLV